MEKRTALETRHLTKRFPGIVAVDNVDFEVHSGEVHALLGENGAGKSTFCKLLSGVHRPTDGEILLDGKPVVFRSPHDALLAGLSMVYQERNLIPFLTGAQNICLGNEQTRLRWGVHDTRTRRTAEKIRDRVGAKVDLDIEVQALRPSEQQVIEILRALFHQPRLLLLDEPTASLTHRDAEMLFEVIRNVTSQGVGVIFISHKLEEVFRIADRVTIFRDGVRVVVEEAGELNRESCIRYMTNREIGELYPEVRAKPSDELLLQVEDVSDFDKLHDVSFTLSPGEVVGFYGLVGSGRTELAELLFGLSRKRSGSVRLNGEQLDLRSSAQAIEHGIFLVPEDRARHGLFDLFNLKENLTIPVLSRLLNRLRLIDHRAETHIATRIAENEDLRLVYTNIHQDVESLSGGNKQKILIARWLAKREEASVIILDEPTQGIDIGVKHEIYDLLRQLAEQHQLGVIFISSELGEVIGISDRVYVFKNGTIVKELNRDEIDSQEQVLKWAF
ncbi:sugar ABC transporter ATP-binding protein [Candidatus Bipolaricaulota bacterium]|nr:sugar ABC transporter ATP-binding protein [Candidatus Bipolaricaulota bacterium]